MRPFRFRFDSLMDLRARERDQAGMDVAKAVEAIDRVNEQIAQIEQQRTDIRNQQHETLQRDGVSVDQMLQHGRYDVQLHADQINLRQTLTQLNTELEKRRVHLVAAEAEVKRLERLRATQLAEHRVLESKQEQAEADDLTSARVVMMRRAAMARTTAQKNRNHPSEDLHS